jgi:hypothetical protein
MMSESRELLRTAGMRDPSRPGRKCVVGIPG